MIASEQMMRIDKIIEENYKLSIFEINKLIVEEDLYTTLKRIRQIKTFYEENEPKISSALQVFLPEWVDKTPINFKDTPMYKYFVETEIINKKTTENEE